MKEINVTIPAQAYSPDKYSSNNNCYLAEAIRLIMPNAKIYVSGFGCAKIDSELYESSHPFDAFIVMDAFEKGNDIKVKMIKDESK